MSETTFDREMIEKAGNGSSDTNAKNTPVMLHQMTCPECGENTLDVIDSGIFVRSPILGITSDGEIGCLYTEPEGDYQLKIYCRNCSHELSSDLSVTGEFGEAILADLANSSVKASPVLPFTCPKCNSRELRKVEVAVEFSYDVVAVCEADAPGTNPLVAVGHLRNVSGGTTYC